jgi:radical SAM protein with 4Fe4S-binding SPASM domain
VPGLTKPSHAFKVNRETENIILLSRDLATRSLVWYSRPTEIEFSFNNLCNLKCIMCGKADDEPNQVMDPEKGGRVLEEILPYALHLTPSANSEPFLNDMGLITQLCEKHDVSLFLFTNGMLCTEERFRKIQPSVHRLWFSFDSHVKETYETIRKGGRYDVVVKNIQNTLRLAAEDDTEITFHFVLMRLNLRQLPEYIRFIASLGGNQVKVQELLPNSRSYNDLKVEGAFPQEEILAVLERAKETARELKIDLALALKPPFAGEVRSLPMRRKSKAPMAAFRELYMESFLRVYPKFCNMAAHYLKITPDGGVYPCCRAPDVLKMGDVSLKSIETIWNDEPYQQFRKKMFEGNYESVCRNCSILTGNPHFQC